MAGRSGLGRQELCDSHEPPDAGRRLTEFRYQRYLRSTVGRELSFQDLASIGLGPSASEVLCLRLEQLVYQVGERARGRCRRTPP
jgi:hypothetical protein